MFFNSLRPLTNVKAKHSSINTFYVFKRVLTRCFSTKSESCKAKPTLLNPDCKTAVIVGGNGGIGFATAHQLLCDNAKKVALIGRNTKTGMEAVTLLNCTFGKSKAMFCKCDIQNLQEVESTLHNIKTEFEEIDIVVNAAGMWGDACWPEEMQTNLAGTINVNLAASDHLVKGDGVIINITGFTGLAPFPPSPFFAGFSSGVIHFSRSFGHDVNFRRLGMRVVVLCVGITQTDLLVDIEKRMLTKEMGADLMAFLKAVHCQKPDACAKSVIEVIKYGPTGSVWLVEGSRLFYYDIPDYRKCLNLVSQFI